jgi:hypothetical protein
MIIMKSLNSDGQQLQYQQNKQIPLISNQGTQNKVNLIYGIGGTDCIGSYMKNIDNVNKYKRIMKHRQKSFCECGWCRTYTLIFFHNFFLWYYVWIQQKYSRVNNNFQQEKIPTAWYMELEFQVLAFSRFLYTNQMYSSGNFFLLEIVIYSRVFLLYSYIVP